MKILDWNTARRRRAARGARAPARRSARRRRRAARARSSTRCAPTVMPRCARYTQQFDGVDARRARASAAAEFRAARAALTRGADRARSSAPSPTFARFHAAQLAAPLSRRDHARRALRAHHAAHRQRRSVRAGGLGAAALHRDHAGRAGAHRRLPGARRCARRPTADGKRQRRGAGGRRAVRHRDGVQGRRRAGDRRDGLSARRPFRKVDKIFGPGQRLGHGRQADRRRGSGGRRHRSAGRPFGSAGHRRRLRERRASSRPICWRRPSTTRIAQAILVTTSRELADAPSPMQSQRRCATCRAARSSSESMASSRCIVVPDLDDGDRRLERIRARASHHPDARAARAAARRSPCAGSVFLGAVVARIHGRLLLRHQPRAAHIRLCARLQRPVGARLPEAHHGAGAHRRRPARARPHGRRRSPTSKDWTRTRSAVDACASTLLGRCAHELASARHSRAPKSSR